MMLKRPMIPCPTRGCLLPVLRDNNAWHVRYTGPNTYQLIQQHDTTADDWIEEEIEEYD